MKPIKKWAMIITATIYSVKFESSLIIEFLSKLQPPIMTIRNKSHI